MQLLEQADGVVYHVRSFRQLILRSLNLFDGEEFIPLEMSEKRENEVAIAVWDNCLGEVVFGHFDDRDLPGDRDTWFSSYKYPTRDFCITGTQNLLTFLLSGRVQVLSVAHIAQTRSRSNFCHTPA